MRSMSVAPMVLFVSLLCAVGVQGANPNQEIAKDKSRWTGHAKGAELKERFHVVDLDGCPITNAIVEVVFGGVEAWNAGHCVKGATNVNGDFEVQGVSHDRIEYVISKSGFYASRGEIVYVDTTAIPAVKDGRWQPYGKIRTVVMKKMLNPTELIESNGLKYHKYPPLGKWSGFDLCKRDWVYPNGAGEFADVEIRISKESTADGYVKTMDVSFTNNLCAGAYEMKADSFSELKTIYEADTNAVFSSLLKYTFKRGKNGNERDELADGSYLVFRTRTKVNKDGKLLSAHYGIIAGNWRFCEKGGMAVERLMFNPTPNDTNLEDAETARLSQLGYRQRQEFEWRRKNGLK